MADTIDLNIENYRIEELLYYKFKNKVKIKQRINELNYKFKSKPKILFF